ncbi:MAG: cardiolipin synthase [Syntrophobacteraceae bacterium]
MFFAWKAVSWAIPFIMLPVIASRQQPTAALAWMLLIFFQPWIGIIIYFLFGENRVLRRLTKTYCQRIKEIRSFQTLPADGRLMLYSPGDKALNLQKVTERLICLPAMQGNSVELLTHGDEVIDRLIADIDLAKDHVHLLFYIFQDDPIGRRVAKAMARAVKRGIKARLVVDAFGARTLTTELGPWLLREGVELHSLMSINPFRRHHTRLDLRNHRKLAIIDGRIAYTGSQNIEAKDYDRGRAEAWHDVMVRIIGPAVLHLQMVFVEDWYLATDDILEGAELFPNQSMSGEIPIQVVPTGPTEPNTALRDILITAIGGANNSIVITSPYFIPDEPFRVALHLASLRGVKIDLLIPRHTDHVIVGTVARAYISSLIDSGVNIHFHRGLLHSKTMTIDGTVSVIGTANFDRRSFFLHSELGLILYGPEITSRARAIQAEYMEQSTPLEPLKWKRRSPVKRIRDNIFKILSPIL